MAAKAKRKVVRAAPMALAERWTAAKREAFLRALVETANVVGASRAVGVPENSPYHLRRKDDDFARAWDRALDEAYSKLTREDARRAFRARYGCSPISADHAGTSAMRGSQTG